VNFENFDDPSSAEVREMNEIENYKGKSRFHFTINSFFIDITVDNYA
jgi:hypothetical protein